MNIIKTNNDKLGLTGITYVVPKEVPRPQSAIDYDRKSDKEVRPYEYPHSRGEYEKKRASERESHETEEQVI